MSSIIRIESVVRLYGDYMALDGVSFEIAEGEFVAIMGPSGCGKSTLLNIVGLLDRPTSGRYLIDGADASTLSDSERTHLRRRK
ncbi:MAG: ATP-binding cassette domain-containing protein, partial [Elusimicrobiota bacterium]